MSRVVEILLVEDHHADVTLTRRALKQVGTVNRLHVAVDGVEAMEFLRKAGRHAKAPRPDLILLDLNMPRKNGREVLHEIKQDVNLHDIPVVMLTTSSASTDVYDCYRLCANSYVVKPVKFSDFVEVIKRIDLYWFQTARIPSP